MSEPVTRLLGIRHHGPGSARAIADELPRIEPDLVLIEGPPEADGLVELAGDPELEPPVALLAYAVDDTTRAAMTIRSQASVAPCGSVRLRDTVRRFIISRERVAPSFSLFSDFLFYE